MCVLCPRAAKLIRVPWLGNMKDENAVSCCAQTCGWLVGHDKTLQVTCNNHTNPQAPTTAACILQINYGKNTCSKANAFIQRNLVNNKARRTRTMHCPTRGLVFNATAHKQPIVSVPHRMQAAHPNSSSRAHEILFTKTIMHVKLLAYILNSVWLQCIMMHLSSSYSCPRHPYPLPAAGVTLQDLHTAPHMPRVV